MSVEVFFLVFAIGIVKTLKSLDCSDIINRCLRASIHSGICVSYCMCVCVCVCVIQVSKSVVRNEVCIRVYVYKCM